MKRPARCRYFKDGICTLKAKIITVRDGKAAECENCNRRKSR